jgi:hypothetical protein
MTLPYNYTRKLNLPKGLSYTGSFENRPELTKSQEKILNEIKKILSNHDIHFSKVWYGKFKQETKNSRYSMTKKYIYQHNFAMKSACGTVLWRRYEADNPGGSQNTIYIKSKKYFINSWLNNPILPNN